MTGAAQNQDGGPIPASGSNRKPEEPIREISPAVAILLSALVLPGLGQIFSPGRRGRGLIMAALAALWLPLALIKVGLDLNKIMPDLMSRAAAKGSLSLADLQELMSPMAGGLIWLLMPLAAIWLWAVADAVANYLRLKKEG